MPTGRPRLLTDEKLSEICSLVAAGLPLSGVVRHLGCHIRTVRREQQRDEAFRHAFSEAELTARLEPERLLRQAAATHWRAAAWLLERTKRRRGRSAPWATLPEGLQALSDAMIEAVLGQLNDPAERRAAYDNLTAVSAIAIRDILTGGSKALRKRMNTPLTHAIEFDQHLESYSPPRWKCDSPRPTAPPLDFANAAKPCAQGAPAEDKTPAAPSPVNTAELQENRAQPPLAPRSAA